MATNPDKKDFQEFSPSIYDTKAVTMAISHQKGKYKWTNKASPAINIMLVNVFMFLFSCRFLQIYSFIFQEIPL